MNEPTSDPEGAVEEIEVTLLPEPDEPDPGHLDMSDSYVEGVDAEEAGIMSLAEQPRSCGLPERWTDGDA